ncbi:hypothetical protein HZA96_00910 [Candidatus Woesearchaeota archaeon]|nr:hypothetical protein [Candidatus Woesearchaeota archaeon]
MKNKKHNKQNNNKLIYISIISIFAILGVTLFTLNNSNFTGYAVKDTEKPRIISSQIIEDEQGNKVLSLELFDNNAINKVVAIYSAKNEDGTEKLQSISTTQANQLLKFNRLTPAGSYYITNIKLNGINQGARLFVVISDYENNRENKLLVVE